MSETAGATTAPAGMSAGASASEFIRRYGIAVVFVAVVIAMCIASPAFRTRGNALNLLQQNAILGMMACAMTFAIVLGGFDLSVGSVAALASVAGAKVMIVTGSIPLGIVAALTAGLIAGVVNGLLIAYLGVNPFVSTLGTMTIVRGLVYVYTNATPLFGAPFSFTRVGLGKTLGIPNPFWIFLGVALVLIFILRQTQFGHYVYAIGGHPAAAVAGIILIGQTATGQPQGALGYELTAIAAVIVGGASLSGGQGSAISTIIGVFLLGVVSNALNLFGVSPFWQGSAIGTIIILALLVERLVSSRANR